MKLPNHTALKEWSSVIEALDTGRQTILIRKGGIADPMFGVEAERFYLLPTYFHTTGLPAESLAVTHWCEVVQTWRIHDLEKLYALEPLTIFTRANLDERYRFRPDQAIHVIAVRAMRLPATVMIPAKPEYGGCRSWISIDEEIEVDGSVAVLTPGDVERIVAEVQSMIG